MVEPHAIPQSEYERAANERLRRLEAAVDYDSFRAVWLLHQAADSAREFQTREALKPFALTWTQFEVLWNMWVFGERDAGFIARAALISKSGLTSILAHLEGRGLVERRADDDDGRKSLLRLSASAHALMREVLAALDVADQAFCTPLTTSQKEELIGLLNKLLGEAGHGVEP